MLGERASGETCQWSWLLNPVRKSATVRKATSCGRGVQHRPGTDVASGADLPTLDCPHFWTSTSGGGLQQALSTQATAYGLTSPWEASTPSGDVHELGWRV